MIQPAVGSPTTLPELQRAIAFGEVLGVRQRVLVGDEDGRRAERALPELAAAGADGPPRPRHRQVVLPREDVERVHVDEPAVVVAHVDDHALARVILGVEIEIAAD